MQLPDNDTNSPGNDWLAAAHKLVDCEGPGIHFEELKTGDVLLIRTRNTLYRLEWLGKDYLAELTTNRSDRTSGRIQLQGCTIGKGSTLAFDRLFCGGGMEFTSENGKWTHRTSAIRELRLVQNNDG